MNIKLTCRTARSPIPWRGPWKALGRVLYHPENWSPGLLDWVRSQDAGEEIERIAEALQLSASSSRDGLPDWSHARTLLVSYGCSAEADLIERLYQTAQARYTARPKMGTASHSGGELDEFERAFHALASETLWSRSAL